MDINSLKTQPTDTLLCLFSQILEELRRRSLVRSSNNPTGDFAEMIAARALDLTLVGKSGAGHDATDASGVRYQIKARRATQHNRSRQLSFIRNLDTRPFDYLVGIIFNVDFQVERACIVPFEVVRARVTFSKHMGAHRLLLTDDVWTLEGTRDVTQEFQRAAKEICTACECQPAPNDPRDSSSSTT